MTPEMMQTTQELRMKIEEGDRIFMTTIYDQSGVYSSECYPLTTSLRSICQELHTSKIIPGLRTEGFP